MSEAPDRQVSPASGSDEGLAAAHPQIDRVALEARAGEGYDLWHSACRPVLEVANREPLSQFQAALEFYEVDGLLFNHTRYSATAFRRTPSHLRRGDHDPLVLHMLVRGNERGEVATGESLRMGTDRIVLHDWAHPFASVADASEQLCVVIPRERLAAAQRFSASAPVVSWDQESPQGRILGAALRETWRSLPHATRGDAPALAAGFLGLLDGLLDPARSTTGPLVSDQAIAAAMQDFLEARLSDPSLGIDDLTTAFRCSRSTVYRVFREGGGVRAHLADVRLAKAFRLLTASHLPQSVANMAASLGFLDVSYFHRAFKKRYGITPKEAAAMSAAGPMNGTDPSSPQPPEALGTIHRWMGADI